MQLRMKPHQWMATFGLLGLVLATAIGLILTREPEQSISNAGQMPGGEAPLIDEHPLQTARALATLASGSDEQRLAQQAMKVADRELDLAFASGLRDAAEHSAPSKPETKELYARASQAQARVKADQERIDQLTKQLLPLAVIVKPIFSSRSTWHTLSTNTIRTSLMTSTKT